MHRDGSIFKKSVQLLEYSDVIDIIGRTKHNVTVSKPIVILNRSLQRWLFQRAKCSICCGQVETSGISAVTTKNVVRLEIKANINLANRSYCGPLSYDKTNNLYIMLYITFLPVLLYGAEAWILLNTDAAALRVFERKVLRSIFGPVQVGDNFSIRSNRELYELLNEIDVVSGLISRWLGHVV